MSPDEHAIGALATLWKKHDEQNSRILELEKETAVQAHRVTQLEAHQNQMSQQLVQVRGELLAAISAGDASILTALNTYSSQLQTLLHEHNQRLGAGAVWRWLAPSLVTIISATVAIAMYLKSI